MRRRSVLMVVAVLAVLTAACGTVAFRATRRADHRASEVATLRSEQERLLDRVAAAEASERSSLDRSKAARAAAREARAALAELRDTKASLEQKVVVAGAVRAMDRAESEELATCIDGLNRAITQLSVGESHGAAGSMSRVQNACRRAQGDSPGELPYDFADPSILVQGNTAYVYGTNAGGGNVQLARSDDLRHWSFVGDALPRVASWATPAATWAPSVWKRAGRYVLYYTARERSSGLQCISVATSKRAAGPFVDRSSAPLMCQRKLGGTIDPSPFVDRDGTSYLLVKAEGTPVGKSGSIWSQRLNPSGLRTVGRPTRLLTGDPDDWDAGVIEAPSMYRDREGRLWLFFSGAPWSSDDYAVGLAGCHNGPAAPCARATIGPLLHSDDRVAGPGGLAVFRDHLGAQRVVFHAYRPGHVGYPNPRILVVGRLRLDHDSVRVDY